MSVPPTNGEGRPRRAGLAGSNIDQDGISDPAYYKCETGGDGWQPDLFSYPPDTGTARKGDPDTSTEAAKSLDPDTLRGLQLEVFDTLVALGGIGTMDDVVLATGRQRGSTSRRLSDLEAGGLIARTGETRPGKSTGRRQIVWQVIDRG